MSRRSTMAGLGAAAVALTVAAAVGSGGVENRSGVDADFCAATNDLYDVLAPMGAGGIEGLSVDERRAVDEMWQRYQTIDPPDDIRADIQIMGTPGAINQLTMPFPPPVLWRARLNVDRWLLDHCDLTTAAREHLQNDHDENVAAVDDAEAQACNTTVVDEPADWC